MRISPVFISIGLSLGFSLAHADVYRWVDGSGGVHYSDVPVQGAVRVRTSTHGDASSRTEPGSSGTTSSVAAARDSSAATAGALAERKALDAAARGVQEDIAKKRAEQCKEATARYEQAIVARRLYKPGKAGERIYLSDAELAETRVQARNERDQACGEAKR